MCVIGGGAGGAGFSKEHIFIDVTKSITVKAFVVTPHEMWEILVINDFEMIFITQFIN